MRTNTEPCFVQSTPLAIIVSMLAVCLLLANCAASVKKFDSRKSADYSQTFLRLFVVTNVTDPMGQDFADSLGESIIAQLSASGLESRVLTLSGLELHDLEGRIATYKPDGLLVIKTAGGTVADYGTIHNVVYDVSLYENVDKRRVWRAKIDFVPAHSIYDDTRGAKFLADQLIQSLKNDGLIR